MPGAPLQHISTLIFTCAADRRRFIDALEGDTVLRAARDVGHLWKGKRVPIYIGSKAFQLWLAKGADAARLGGLRLSSQEAVRAVSVELDCLLVPTGLSTHDNIVADALSRGDISRF